MVSTLFGNMNVSYSIWPIILIPYNVPPWVCMKQSNFILSVLIPGKKGPGKDIDVYMQLTIDDLLELRNDGVMTYDVSSSKKFCLRAALLWTNLELILTGNMTACRDFFEIDESYKPWVLKSASKERL